MIGLWRCQDGLVMCVFVFALARVDGSKQRIDVFVRRS